MTLTIRSSDTVNMELFTEDEKKDIVQNILCILKTFQGSCPNLRDFGIDSRIMHRPVPVAKAAYAVAISNQFRKFENRATLKSISFEDDPDQPGILYPILEVIIP